MLRGYKVSANINSVCHLMPLFIWSRVQMVNGGSLCTKDIHCATFSKKKASVVFLFANVLIKKVNFSCWIFLDLFSFSWLPISLTPHQFAFVGNLISHIKESIQLLHSHLAEGGVSIKIRTYANRGRWVSHLCKRLHISFFNWASNPEATYNSYLIFC